MKGTTMTNDFSYFRAPITNIAPHSAFSLLDAYHYITGGIAKETTAHLRTLSGKAHAIYKQNSFDFCTFSGIFSTRRSGDLLRHSSLVCFDFDHLPDVEGTFNVLLKDKYFPTLLLFRSPSGDGLKWVISMERQFLCREKFFPLENQVDYHPSFFKSVSYYLLNEYGLVTDKSGKDIVRACFLPHDPNAYINEKILQ